MIVETKMGMIARLLLRLKEQYDCNEQIQTIIDDLARYHSGAPQMALQVYTQSWKPADDRNITMTPSARAKSK